MSVITRLGSWVLGLWGGGGGGRQIALSTLSKWIWCTGGQKPQIICCDTRIPSRAPLQTWQPYTLWCRHKQLWKWGGYGEVIHDSRTRAIEFILGQFFLDRGLSHDAVMEFNILSNFEFEHMKTDSRRATVVSPKLYVACARLYRKGYAKFHNQKVL